MVPETTPESILAGMSAERQELFELRRLRWDADLVDALHAVYGPGRTPEIARQLTAIAAAAFRDRRPELHRLDQARTLQPDWLQQPRMIGYAAYADRFAEDLVGVRRRIPYLHELGVTYLHLMPVLRPRQGDNDGGYAVQDYRSLRPDLGTMDDLRDLADELRASGISLVLDLVLNHVAREHEWAEEARAGSTVHREYFLTFPDRTMPDAYEQTLPEVFPDFAPGSFTWDDELGSWVWTTFNEWQWDLNWANPEVLLEFAEIVLFLANAGVEVLRLDAIAFLWKRLGTNSQNQPEVHAITQVLRSVARMACPALAFKAEAIVAPGDLVQYLGVGRHTGKVSDLAYHNTLMVQIWSSLATGDARLAAHAISRLPVAPSTSAWITYLRCHDDIGWAIDDDDAASLGLNGFAHRRFLSEWYAGQFPGSTSRGLVFQANPATGDQRISGTAASLIGVEAAGEQTVAENTALDLALGRSFLAHAIAFGWGGVPVIWSGDELGQANDPDWADEDGHADDNRWAHRPRLDWARAGDRASATTVAGRAFSGLAHLAQVRASLVHLHASVPSEILHQDDAGVLATIRRHPVGPLVGLYNVTAHWRPIHLSLLRAHGISAPFEAISGTPVLAAPDDTFVLPPYAAWWVIDESPG